MIITTLLKKIHAVKNMNWRWFFRYYKKRLYIYQTYVFSKLIGRKFWKANIDGAECKLAFSHPYHHSMARTLRYDPGEKTQLSIWKKQAEKIGQGIILDIGGYNGIYGLIAGVANPQAQVKIFEPDLVNFKHIENNIRLNGLKNVTARQEVISNHSGIIYFGGASGLTAGRISRLSAGSNAEKNYQVKSLTIDECLSAYLCLPILMKFDIFGAEYDALMSATKTLSAAKKISILLEYYPRANSVKPEEDDRFWSYFKNLGFHSVFLCQRNNGFAEYYFVFKE